MTSRTSEPRSGDAPAGDDWRTISEQLLKGLVHALNNRVASLSAFVELAKLGDDEEDPLAALTGEIEQLHRVNALFGLLPQRATAPEAVELRAVLDDAVRLHEHHPRFRDAHLNVTTDGVPDVVRAPRWALLRTMVVLVHVAKREARSAHRGAGAVVRLRADDEMVSAHVAAHEPPSADLEALAAQCGGRVAHVNDELVFTMPSLRELRRREREARGDSPPG